MLADSYVTESATTSWTQQRRPRLYINHFGHPAATLRLPAPRPHPTAPFTSVPPHVPPPTITLLCASHTCVRRCQPRVLLTDVRIDNLCPLIMTVRSRARRYLTVRLIAISREFDGMFRVPLLRIVTKIRGYHSSNSGISSLSAWNAH